MFYVIFAINPLSSRTARAEYFIFAIKNVIFASLIYRI